MNSLPELRTYGAKDIMQTVLAGLELSRSRSKEQRAKGLYDIELARAKREEPAEQRKARKHEADMAKALAEHELNAVKYGGRLLQSVTDEETYQRARSAFARAYPEFAKTLPENYDPEIVDQMKTWSVDYEENINRAGKKTPKIGELRKFKRGNKEITHEWDGEKWVELSEGPAFKPETDKAPPQVKQAQSLVLKFAKSIDPTVAALIAANPAMANNPLVKKAIDAGIPDELKDAYDEAVGILNEYYGVESKPPGSPQPGSPGTGAPSITHEFVPGKGLVEIK